jgi:EAL domain-containing protein (putative c-di-GMP-specific phosphodiesterase class I)
VVAQDPDRQTAPVKAQALLIDPATLEVLWASASESPVPLEHVVPTAEAMGLREALRAVAATGAPRHLSADVVSMARKSVALVVSIHRLPDGTLMLLVEHALHAEHGPRRESASGWRSGRPG